MDFSKTDYGDVKRLNRNLVYRCIYNMGSQSKQDIASTLRLSQPTVDKNVAELIDDGLVITTGMFASTGGRKAQAIEADKKARYSIGLDITRNHLSIVIIDLGCSIVHFKRYEIQFENSESYFENLGRLVREAVKKENISPKKVLGVGIALPAIITSDHASVSYGNYIGFTGGKISQFEEYIEFPCVLLNDANAGGFAETWHRGKQKNTLYISLNNSVGGSILIGGNNLNGENRRAGEVGHLTVRPDGPLCYCGKCGCLDALCNASILANRTNGNLAAFFETLSNDAPDTENTIIWERYLDDLSIAINSLRMVLDADILLGGYVGTFMDEHIDALRKRVAERNTFEHDANYLTLCTFRYETTAVGAALYYVNKFIKAV
ncbi:NagC family transcriptional regulator [Clostridia bacterium]|nr:NagC family transcriptional regulator [Clostridia bacterium]